MKADEMTDERPVETDAGYAALVAHVLGDVGHETVPEPEVKPVALPESGHESGHEAVPGPQAARGERRLARRGWPAAAAAVLAVLLLVGVAAAGVLAMEVRRDAAVERARVGGLTAARSHAQAILSYDHRTLDADFARAQQVITGAFKGEYEKTTAAVVRPTATQYKAVVKAEVTSAGVVRASAGRVVVLLFVDQTTTSTRLPTAKRDSSRVRMTLDEVGGRWLVSAVDAL